MAQGLKVGFGLPLWAGYAVSSLMIIPLVIYGMKILAKLQSAFIMTPAKQPRGSAPAALWDVGEDADRSMRRGALGIISSVSYPFCGDCDRTRLTADGAIRTCLFSNSETQLRDLLRGGASDEELATIWAGAMWEKLPGHDINDESFLQPARTMSAIGG